jgi:hypothetical protein
MAGFICSRAIGWMGPRAGTGARGGNMVVYRDGKLSSDYPTGDTIYGVIITKNPNRQFSNEKP